MLIASYPVKISGVTVITQLNAGITDNSTYLGRNNGYSKNASLTESFIFKIPLTITARGGFTQSLDNLFGYSRNLLGEISASYDVIKYWTASLGLNLDVTKAQNKRTGFSLDNAFKMGEHVNLNIRVEKNNYTDWISGSNNFDEFVFKSTLSTNW